jgi:N-acylneuraminate cytidylyltransferase
MIRKMKYFGIIPARGGSKRIPLKNIRPLNGKPLIEYSIESALSAKILDRIIISTDHDQIIEACRKYKKIDVVKRPPELATDEAPTEWALIHACEEMEKMYSEIPDVILTLEPTSPLRSIDTIKSCINIFKRTDADSVIGVVETRSCYGKIENNHFKFLFPNQPRRRQERTPLYKESSTIYATRKDVLVRKESVLGDKLYPLILPQKEAVDINSHFDIAHVEALIKDQGIKNE